jgi:hypothetical protein
MGISFIILTWNSQNYISNCIESIIRASIKEKISPQVVVVDNGSSDETISIVNKKGKKYKEVVQLIILRKNFGTTYSRNLGLKRANSDYISIIDSDTEIVEGSLRSLLDYLKHNLNVGLIAPRLVMPDGSIQNSVKRFPTLIGKLVKIPKAVLKIPVPDLDFYNDFPFEENREVDTAISACWFFRKEILFKVGLLNESIFYLPEDLDYSARIRKAGLKIVYWPALKITHHTQHISHRKPFSKLSLSHFLGLFYYFRKHGGWISTNHLKGQSKQ